MNSFKLTILTILVLLIEATTANAQCKIKNIAFKSGENITYDLYFNYGFVKAKAGTGSLKTNTIDYKGKSVYDIRMLLNTNGFIGSIFTVNDTLTSYVDMNLRPLLFVKYAYEGKDYSKERQIYSYNGENQLDIRTMRIFNGNEEFDENISTSVCTYDYLSILPLIRNLDYSGMKSGDKKAIQFLAGKNIVNMYVNYWGTSLVKANDGKRYEVINLTMTILDKAFKNPKDAVRASLSNDSLRTPIVLETILKVGAIKAVLKNISY